MATTSEIAQQTAIPASSELLANDKTDNKAKPMLSMIAMSKHSEQEDLKKREKIQRYFWSEVGSVEHISLPMLENWVKKEFEYTDDRSVQAQIQLMQTEQRIRIKSRVKIWIREPQTCVSQP